MENKENVKKVETTDAKIDKDVLDIMKNDEILSSMSDDKQIKRLILNCFCEFLSEIKGLRRDFDEFSQMISVCSADKLADFFKELHGNVAQEEKRQELHKKMSQSHQKSKKSSQNSKKSSKSVK
jgi:GMP synthase PP-ATPase subunit